MATKRVGRVTFAQQERMLEFVEEYPPMMTKKFDANFSAIQYKKQWNDATKLLNAENNHLNARTEEKWQKVKCLKYLLFIYLFYFCLLHKQH